MLGLKKKLVEQALEKIGSRYYVCAVVSKRANQYIRHSDSQGVAWAVNQSLLELVDGRLRSVTAVLPEAMDPSDG